MFVQSRVTDLAGAPLAGVPVDVWHADDDGFYDSQKPSYAVLGPSSRARFVTDKDGRFFFRTILPCSYPVPTDGPVGELILQTNRHAMRPAHVHFLVDAPGYQPLITHVFLQGDKYLDSDVVFGVKDELISTVERRTDPVMPDGKPTSGPWHLMTYEFRMKPGDGMVPKPMMPKPMMTPFSRATTTLVSRSRMQCATRSAVHVHGSAVHPAPARRHDEGYQSGNVFRQAEPCDAKFLPVMLDGGRPVEAGTRHDPFKTAAETVGFD